MSEVFEFDPKMVEEVLAEVFEEADSLKGVMIIGLYKDGSQMLRTSRISGYEKAYLVQFVNAYMASHFVFTDNP